jgi:mannan endo-1,4-beta-mannosidase
MALNPREMDDSGEVRAPKSWDGPGSPTDLSQSRLVALLNSSNPVASNWRKKLDRIADALSELRAAGVIVLWRPMQECNGNRFSWGVDPLACAP